MNKDFQKIQEFKKFFKKFLLKHYGKKCSDYCFGCINCQVWKTYEEFEALIESIKD